MGLRNRVRSPAENAAKLWKLGCTNASGATVSTIRAATASVRNVIARRSTITAISTTAVMKNERCVATSATRQQQIECGGREGSRRRPFLDGVADRERGKQRQQ